MHSWRLSCWQSERSRVLSSLGDRLRTYAERHEGKFPKNVEDLVAAGVITESELSFEDHSQQTSVRREFRLVPSIDLPGDLVIVVERYGRYPEFRLCLYLDGSVVLYGEGATLDDDDAKRKELGLAPA